MGYNPDILENIVQRAGGPRDIYFPIYPFYLYYNISEYLDQRTLVFYFYPMYNAKYRFFYKLWFEIERLIEQALLFN